MDLRARSAEQDAWLAERLDTVLPALMREAGIEAWVIAGREGNEDPVLSTMLPAEWLSARRRTILVVTEHGERRAAISRYDVGEVFPGIWDPDEEPDQWRRLADYLIRASPLTIAINTSDADALADGMTATEMRALRAALPQPLAERITPADDLAIGWLATRGVSEVAAYPEICATAHGFLQRALSREVIDPGVTTTADVAWWLRQVVAASGLQVWFHPAVSVQRRGSAARTSFAATPGPTTIEGGDLVHIDFGIVDRGLHTDQQHHGYVLGDAEAVPPYGLVQGLNAANRAQHLLLEEFALGRTGNEVLSSALAAAEAAGLTAKIYTHPIGVHGHGAGPTIGLWDAQDGVPGAGDRRITRDTAFAIELSVEVAVPEWDRQRVSFMLEEEAFFDGDRIDWLDGRQTELHVI